MIISIQCWECAAVAVMVIILCKNCGDDGGGRMYCRSCNSDSSRNCGWNECDGRIQWL